MHLPSYRVCLSRMIVYHLELLGALHNGKNQHLIKLEPKRKCDKELKGQRCSVIILLEISVKLGYFNEITGFGFIVGIDGLLTGRNMTLYVVA